VVTTTAGKGVFPETHPLALGVFGTFGTAAANAAVSGADLILAIGTKLGPSDTAWENRDLLDPIRQTFIQIDIEPKNASWTFPAEHVLVGDAAIVLTQMPETVASKSSGRRAAGESRVADLRRAHGYFNARAYTADDAPLLPQRVIGELMRMLPPEAIVTCDAGGGSGRRRCPLSPHHTQPQVVHPMGEQRYFALASPNRPIPSIRPKEAITQLPDLGSRMICAPGGSAAACLSAMPGCTRPTTWLNSAAGLGRHVLAVPMRRVRDIEDEVVTRPGRYYKQVADNLQVKEVWVGDGERVADAPGSQPDGHAGWRAIADHVDAAGGPSLTQSGRRPVTLIVMSQRFVISVRHPNSGHGRAAR
jgi:Thiamine pyrophosphate enzyme, central domain